MSDRTDRETLRRALVDTPRFVYANAFRLVLISVAWFFLSLPVVTIGPATLGAYVAIIGLKSDANRIDWKRVGTVLRSSGLPAALLTGVPMALGLAGLSYVLSFAATPSLVAEVVALTAFYGATYLVLVFIPTFVFLARGDDEITAFKHGIAWTSAHPTLVLVTGLVTLCLLAVSVVLTIAFVLLFPALAFSFQLAVVRTSTAPN
ncbi:hypothetical protein [Halomicrococcus sp. NG-SE-24]|uniref:hypothetical protein n=1 Tax=Halomicrococcus sp. NG-SE-24 TaxID=3436928 RepID=UPI003D961F6E